MNDMASELIQHVLLRWAHVVAGILWIGHLYFFNFVNAQVAKTYDADSKKKVVPELMPRALYWFRWGAMYTWTTGILLAGLVYYMGGMTGAQTGIGLALVLFGFFVYDLLWKAMAAKETAGATVSFVLVAALAFGLSRVFDGAAVGGGRATFIHVGMVFGTIMFMNVWMRIWPAQRKIIAAIQGGTAPDAALVAMAGLRSKQNVYMSVPLVFLMLSNHASLVLGGGVAGIPPWGVIVILVALGWGTTKLLYSKSAGPAPKCY